MSKIDNVLGDNIGCIELVDYLGGDLANVNGARASFATRKEEFDEKDVKLLNRLGVDIHHTPLRHSYFQFYVEAPEFVARQWYKHIVGCEYAFKDLPWSEFSQRYKEVPPEFYTPRHVRIQGKSGNRQSSTENSDTAWQATQTWRFAQATREAYEQYQALLDAGVAREHARLVLPMSTYTSWTWTASLQAVVHFCALRDHEGAQWEIVQYAKALRSLVEPLAPYSYAALEASHPLVLKSAQK